MDFSSVHWPPHIQHTKEKIRSSKSLCLKSLCHFLFSCRDGDYFYGGFSSSEKHTMPCLRRINHDFNKKQPSRTSKLAESARFFLYFSISIKEVTHYKYHLHILLYTLYSWKSGCLYTWRKQRDTSCFYCGSAKRVPGSCENQPLTPTWRTL